MSKHEINLEPDPVRGLQEGRRSHFDTRESQADSGTTALENLMRFQEFAEELRRAGQRAGPDHD